MFNGQNKSADKITLDFGDDKAVSGDKKAVNAFLSTVFAHEIAHGYGGRGFRRSDPAQGSRETGAVVDAVNHILQARGLPLRERYTGTTTAEYWVTVPHGYADRKNRQIQYNASGGIRVKEETKLIVRWLRRSVGGKGVN